MTKKEIIEETVAYYSEDTARRAIDTTGCHYQTISATGEEKYCAVGRCLDPKVANYDATGNVLYYAYDFASEDLDSHLKPQYRRHSLGFWKSLQMFHDVSLYWDDKCLTDKGKEKLQSILKAYVNE
jgi:hypothetical protein